jgi:hypothetical protein
VYPVPLEPEPVDPLSPPMFGQFPSCGRAELSGAVSEPGAVDWLGLVVLGVVLGVV